MIPDPSSRHFARLMQPELGFRMGLSLTRPGGGGGGGGSVGTRWQFPAWFSNGSFPVNLVGVPGDTTFSTTYDEADFIDTGTTYYVTTMGDDTTGDGSSGTPWRTIQKAVDTAVADSIISVGEGRFAYFTVASKNLSVVGVEGQTFVGDMLAESDITWGTLGSGRQTATLASSTVSGFVDLTLTRRSYSQVSLVCASATEIASGPQASSLGGVFRSTPSQVGAGDARDLSGSADTDIIVWKATAAAPVGTSGTTQLFAKNVIFVGGANITVAGTSRLVLDNCQHLGAVGQSFLVTGTSVLKDTVVRGCGASGCDLIDYVGNVTGTPTTIGVEINVHADQCSGTGGDNCSTGHSRTRLMRVMGSYLDGSRCINDNGGTIAGTFGSTVQSSGDSDAFSLAFGPGEAHFAAITFGLPGAGYDMMFTKDITFDSSTSAGLFPASRVNFYDDSYSGKSQADSTSGVNQTLVITDRSGVKPTTPIPTLNFDPSDLSTLFQDAAGTVPVTTAGDAVVRINSTQSANDYAEVVAGSLTYQTSGGLHWLQTGGVSNLRIQLKVTSIVFDGASNIIFGIKSSDTTGLFLTAGGTNSIGDYRSSGNLSGAYPSMFNSGAPTYTVNGGATTYTTATPFKTAAFNNANNIITVNGANLAYIGWPTAPNLLLQFDGNIYAIEFNMAAAGDELRAREEAIAALTGATLV